MDPWQVSLIGVAVGGIIGFLSSLAVNSWIQTRAWKMSKRFDICVRLYAEIRRMIETVEAFTFEPRHPELEYYNWVSKPNTWNRLVVQGLDQVIGFFDKDLYEWINWFYSDFYPDLDNLNEQLSRSIRFFRKELRSTIQVKFKIKDTGRDLNEEQVSTCMNAVYLQLSSLFFSREGKYAIKAEWQRLATKLKSEGFKFNENEIFDNFYDDVAEQFNDLANKKQEIVEEIRAKKIREKLEDIRKRIAKPW